MLRKGVLSFGQWLIYMKAIICDILLIFSSCLYDGNSTSSYHISFSCKREKRSDEEETKLS